MAAARIGDGVQDKQSLGNLGAQRDWSFAGDYVEGMWRIVQADSADDYVLATGEIHTVREFCEMAFKRVGIKLEFRGTGVDEVAVDAETGRTLIAVDERYFRPTEVELLLGDATKAKVKLGWEPRVGFQELVEMMVDADVTALRAGEPFTLDPSLSALITTVE